MRFYTRRSLEIVSHVDHTTILSNTNIMLLRKWQFITHTKSKTATHSQQGGSKICLLKMAGQLMWPVWQQMKFHLHFKHIVAWQIWLQPIYMDIRYPSKTPVVLITSSWLLKQGSAALLCGMIDHPINAAFTKKFLIPHDR